MTERITTVKFLRTQAEQAGGLDTPRGRALHKAAGYVVRLHEELRRVRDCRLGEEGHAERRLAAARGIYDTMRARAIASGEVMEAVAPEWTSLSPEGQEGWLVAADAALGVPPPPEADE